jgi:hypothetical protein
MAEFSAGFKVTADPTAFEAGMARANAAGTRFKKALASIGVEARGMGLGLAVGVGLAALRNAVEDAKKTAKEARKLGKDVDGGTMALVRFGETMSGLRGLGTTAFGAIAQGMEKVGLFVGGLVYGFDNAADAAAKMKKEAEAAAKALTDEKLMAAQRDLAKFREETGFKRASDEEKINLLLSRQVEMLREQAKVGQDTAEGVKLQLADIAEVSGRIEKQRAQAAEEKAKLDAESAKAAQEEKAAREQALQAEQDQITAGYEREAQLKAQTAELEAQERRLSKMLALSSMLNSAGGSVFRQASDSELQERLRRSQQTVINQQNSIVGKDGSVGALIVGADIGRLQIEIANIKSELAAREQLRRDYQIGGEAMARRNFKGDPLSFDDEFARLVADTRTNKEIQAEALRQLREINDRQKNGIAVVNLNKK